MRKEIALDFGGTSGSANHLKSHPFPLEEKVKKPHHLRSKEI